MKILKEKNLDINNIINNSYKNIFSANNIYNNNIMQTIKNKYNKLRQDEEERYKKEILEIQSPYKFYGNIEDLKKPFNEDEKYLLRIVRVRNKFIDRMYEKYPELKNNDDNKRPLQQIFNKREFNYLNKYNNEIDRVNEMLNLYKTLRTD